MDEAQGGGECEADVATVTAKTGSRAVEAGDVAMVAARTGSRAAILSGQQRSTAVGSIGLSSASLCDCFAEKGLARARTLLGNPLSFIYEVKPVVWDFK